LLREGWKAKEDDVPAEFNFTEPLTQDAKEFEEMREAYYKLRGWDPETGLQKKETLERLGMSDLIPELKRYSPPVPR
jgi:aldehyde:ferredoxin oxidoreductase